MGSEEVESNSKNSHTVAVIIAESNIKQGSVQVNTRLRIVGTLGSPPPARLTVYQLQPPSAPQCLSGSTQVPMMHLLTTKLTSSSEKGLLTQSIGMKSQSINVYQ
ncbi:hypothetical protein PPTG_24349 [Phytophthora nicotianae INRA-310]|uniref:Uncharacterized protein n=1 Tax=Phytophthora nicotianae (strain INRA-310) TaxID=761204 RepID=W2PI99_PHYN3|nr:hypothetical protein PPTG_24349 [Phytophthora nicotianae INRA-310]ETM99953.1 hypothetical protein PPTG_24349 [Phytophthora nicotianae INRA-310]